VVSKEHALFNFVEIPSAALSIFSVFFLLGLPVSHRFTSSLFSFSGDNSKNITAGEQRCLLGSSNDVYGNLVFLTWTFDYHLFATLS
jgi:hypothetical protein